MGTVAGDVCQAGLLVISEVIIDAKSNVSIAGRLWSEQPLDNLTVRIHIGDHSTPVEAQFARTHLSVGLTRVDWRATARGDSTRVADVRVVAASQAGRVAATVEAASSTPPAGSANGALETPSDGEQIDADHFLVRGWCLFPGATLSTVRIVIDGTVAGYARIFMDRSDIAQRFDCEPHAPVAGFEALLSVGDHRKVERSLLFVEALSLDGQRWRSEPHLVRWTTPSSDSSQDLGRPAVVASRTVDSLSRIDNDRSRVLVFTHDLSVGGGQLWLSELLRQLAHFSALDCEVVSIADGPLRRDLEARGIPVHVTAPCRLDSIDTYEGRVRELAMLIASRDAGVILANTLELFPAVDAASRAGVPSLWAIHESYEPAVFRAILNGGRAESGYVKSRFEAAFGLARALVFEASQTADLFRSLSRPERRFVVDYGVDVPQIDSYRAENDRMLVRRGLGFGPDDILLVVVGVFEGRKAQAAVAAAFAELAQVHPTTQLVLVGSTDSSYTHAVRHQVNRSPFAKRIRLVPVTPDIYHWYLCADLFICASDVESLPRSILEAMAFELPIVSTDAFGVADLIRDGRTGWLTRPRDLGGLVGRMHQVLTLDPSERLEVGRAGRAEALRRSGKRAYGRTFAAALARLLERPDAELGDILTERPMEDNRGSDDRG